MKNTVVSTPTSVSEKTRKEHVQHVRVSDMGIRMKTSKEDEQKQPATAAL